MRIAAELRVEAAKPHSGLGRPPKGYEVVKAEHGARPGRKTKAKQVKRSVAEVLDAHDARAALRDAAGSGEGVGGRGLAGPGNAGQEAATPARDAPTGGGGPDQDAG